MAKLEGDITATGTSDIVQIFGPFNFSLKGFGVGTVALERSLNNGDTWDEVEAFTANTSKTGDNAGMCLLRVNCTAYTSGTIHYIVSGKTFYGV